MKQLLIFLILIFSCIARGQTARTYVTDGNVVTELTDTTYIFVDKVGAKDSTQVILLKPLFDTLNTYKMILPFSTTIKSGIIYKDSIPWAHDYPGDNRQITNPAFDSYGKNLFMGKWSGNLNMDSDSMTAVMLTGFGDSTLASITTGVANTAMGSAAMCKTTSGSLNSAFGRQALWKNTTGYSNTSIGESSLERNTTGGQNSALGTNALMYNYTGIGNVGVGFNAGFTNGDADGNIAIGYYAMFGTAGVGIFGDLNIAIGQDALREAFGEKNIGIGHAALYNNTSSFNVAIGDYSQTYSTEGIGNTSVGYMSARTLGVGQYNSAFGMYAGYNMTLATYNVYNGYRAGFSNTEGQSNTVIGGQAMRYSTDGDCNVLIGANAGLGVSGVSNYTGNVAIGYESGEGLTTGIYNTLVGFQSGKNITTARNCIIIAGTSEADVNYQLNIGNVITGTTTSGSERVTIDAIFQLEPIASAPASPQEGWIYANSTDHHLYFYNGTGWVQLDN